MQHHLQHFATSLLNYVRTSNELETILNYNFNGDSWDPSDTQTLARLKLAIKYKQKTVRQKNGITQKYNLKCSS